jgi:ABC-type antimicrobial peptide transport system permease subunit
MNVRLIERKPDALGLVAGVAASMAVAGLIGAAVPAMRALRIQPTDALRAE